jgi:hypothetical protein
MFGANPGAVSTTKVEQEFDGDQCVVLPSNYMASVDAAVELYDDELAKVGKDLEVRGLSYGAGRILFRIGLIASLLWLLPSLWMLCE